MGNFLSDLFSPPEQIDPNKVGEYMTSDATGKMSQRADDMINSNSAMMQAFNRMMGGQAQNDLYTQTRLARQNSARQGGGQSGILNANIARTANATAGNNADRFSQMILGNLNQSNSLLGQVQAGDQRVGDAMASAYGQNVNNQSNYQAGIDSMGLQLGTNAAMMLAMCDGRMKKDVKKIGHTTTKGKKIGVYSFKYKGKDKKHHGVIAQEVQKVNPEAVSEGKNGLLYVNYGKL